MSSISLQNPSSPDDHLNLVLAGMDSNGYLLPDTMPKIKQLIQSSDPLLDADPILLSLIDHYLELPGVGSGNLLASHLSTIAETYTQFRVELLKLIPQQLLSVELTNTLCGVVDQLHHYELALKLASNGTLNPIQYKQIVEYFKIHSNSINLGVDQILDTIILGDESSCLAEALQDLKDLPRRISLCRPLRFTADQNTTLEVGDIVNLDHVGRATILELLDNGSVRCLAYDTSHVSYEEKIFNLSSSSLAGSTIERGQSLLAIPGEEPFSARQPFRPGVHVTRAPKRFSSDLFEIGEVIAYESKSYLKVLWRYDNGGIGVEINSVDQLRVVAKWPFEEESYRTFLEQSTYSSWGTPLSKALEKKNATMDTVRQGDDIRALSDNVLNSKFPLAIHVVDELTHHLNRSGYIDEILRDVALSSRVINNHPRGSAFRDFLTSIPEDEARYLQNHGCMPVVLVLGSAGDPNLLKHLIKLEERGWKLIICRDITYALEDQYLNGAIADIKSFGISDHFTIIDYYDGEANKLDQVIKELGEKANELLDQEFIQQDRERAIKQERLVKLTREVDLLAEQNPSRPITRLNYDLSDLNEELKEVSPELFLVENGTNLPPLSGETSSKLKWNFRELLEISSALAKSRLEVGHPAVAIRGITCLDLSPMALSKLIQQGAKIFRIADQNDVSRGVAITFSPHFTDITRPGLSESLGHPASTGYVYWIWVDPESTGLVRAPYVKLLNRMIIEQIADGATYLFGRVLEKNTPSMRAARGIAGFELIPTKVNILGEPAIGVGLKLLNGEVKIENLHGTTDPRKMMQEAYDILVAGLGDNLPDLDLKVQREERVNQIKDFLVAAIIFKESCEELFKNAAYLVRWSIRDKLIENVEMNLPLVEPYLSYDLYHQLEEALLACTKDDQFETQIGVFKTLLCHAMPESSRALTLQLRQLIESAGDKLVIENNDMPSIPIESLEINMRSIELPLPPSYDIEQIHLRAKSLPENIIRILDSWWNISCQKFLWVGNNHPDIYRCHRLLRQWINSDIQDRGRFCSKITISKDHKDLTSQAIEHIEHFNEFIDWANQIARLDYYDHTIGNYLWPIIHAFLGRQVQ